MNKITDAASIPIQNNKWLSNLENPLGKSPINQKTMAPPSTVVSLSSKETQNVEAPIRKDKVAAIQQQIKNGTFVVHPSIVAKNLLSSNLDLIRKP